MFNNEWKTFLEKEFKQPYFQELAAFLKVEYVSTKDLLIDKTESK